MNYTEKGSKLYLFSIVLVAVIGGLLFGYDTAVISGAEKGLQAFFMGANQVYAETHDPTAHIPEGFDGGSIDFAASFFGWTIYRGVKLSYVGAALLVLVAITMMFINRRIIVRSEKEAKESAK